MIPKIIAAYLTDHRRLVIPQLGAFLVKDAGGDVLFSEMLKRDDGVLRSLLEQQGMSELEAAGMVDRFVFELRHCIEAGSVYEAPGLGIFAQGENSTIRFRHLPTLGQEESQTPTAEQNLEPVKAEKISTENANPEEQPAPIVNSAMTADWQSRPQTEPAATSVEKPTATTSERPLLVEEPTREEAEPEIALSTENTSPEHVAGEAAATIFDADSENPEEILSPAKEADTAEEDETDTNHPIDPHFGEEPMEPQVNETRRRIKSLLRFEGEHPREHRSSSQPRRTDPSVRGLRYGKPQKNTDAYTYVNSAPSRRPDTFMILAILAAIIALGAILYGYLNDRKQAEEERIYMEQIASEENLSENGSVSN